MTTHEPDLTYANVMKEIGSSWDELQAFISSLSEEELKRPRDAAGWSVQDHLMHLAQWEQVVLNMFAGRSEKETLDLPSEAWEKGGDAINGAIREKFQNLSAAEVLKTFREIHAKMLAKVAQMSEEELMLPLNHYLPTSTSEKPILRNVLIDAGLHFREHLPWMKAIVQRS